MLETWNGGGGGGGNVAPTRAGASSNRLRLGGGGGAAITRPGRLEVRQRLAASLLLLCEQTQSSESCRDPTDMCSKRNPFRHSRAATCGVGLGPGGQMRPNDTKVWSCSRQLTAETCCRFDNEHKSTKYARC